MSHHVPMTPAPRSSAPRTSTSLRTTVGDRMVGSGIVTAGYVGLMWVVEAIDTVTNDALRSLGVDAWHVGDLWSVVTSPFEHAGWGHLMANTLLLLVLGFLVGLEGVRRWMVTTLVVTVTSGLAAWLLSAPGTTTVGASGVVFGWFTYLVVRGFHTRHWAQLALAAVLFLTWGGILWGVLPGAAGVSWQAHLGGAIGGILAASLGTGRGRGRRL